MTKWWFRPIFRCVSTSRSHKITNRLTDSRTHRHLAQFKNPKQILSSLKPNLRTCLYFDWGHVYTMFGDGLSLCLHWLWWHVYIVFDGIIILCLMTCLHIYIVLNDMYTPCLNIFVGQSLACLHFFMACLMTYLHTNIVLDAILTPCLNIFLTSPLHIIH